MDRCLSLRIRAALVFAAVCLSVACPDGARAQDAAEAALAPVQTGVSLGLGPALGAEGGSAFYTQITVPIRVSRRWAVGPSFINLAGSAEAGFRSDDGEVKFGEDDRFALGVEVRRALASEGGAFSTYVGVRGMYSNSRQESDGFHGGVIAGGEYALGGGFTAGVEVQAMCNPEHFLFIPLGLISYHF